MVTASPMRQRGAISYMRASPTLTHGAFRAVNYKGSVDEPATPQSDEKPDSAAARFSTELCLGAAQLRGRTHLSIAAIAVYRPRRPL
jgi:hypothetical protein